MIDEVGADSLRLALLTGMTPGQDLRLGHEKIDGSRRFVNKLWNAALFVEATLIDAPAAPATSIAAHPLFEWMRHVLRETESQITSRLQRDAMGDAIETLRKSFWSYASGSDVVTP